jgi:hypothetical protein
MERTVNRVAPVSEHRTVVPQERRRSPRVELSREMVGRIRTSTVPILVRESSQDGFSVESSLSFAVGQEQTFQFTAPDGAATTVCAICRHCMRINVPREQTLYLAGFERSPHL